MILNFYSHSILLVDKKEHDQTIRELLVDETPFATIQTKYITLMQRYEQITAFYWQAHPRELHRNTIRE